MQNCYCEHQNLSLDGTPSVDEEYVSVNVVCDDCGMKGYTTTHPYEWDNEAKLEDVGLPLMVNMYNPNYGELRCSRCRERFEKSAENYVLDAEESGFKMYYLVEMPQMDYLDNFPTLEDAQFAWKELPHNENFIIVERNHMTNKEKRMPRFGAENYYHRRNRNWGRGGRAREMEKAILDFEKWWNRNYTPSN